MGFAIRGLATASPTCKIEQSDAAVFAQSFAASSDARQVKVLQKLYHRTGVASRHSVLLNSSSNGNPADQTFYPAAETSNDRGPSTARRMQAYDQHAGQLATRAASTALSNANVSPNQITHLITVSCSGFSAPGTDIHLINQLRLPQTVARTHVGFMGCHGALNGLRVARAIADAEPEATILLCAVELCSLHYQYGNDPEQIVANALFADGAAAVVGNSTAPGEKFAAPLCSVTANGSTIIPNTEDQMSWKIDDHGFQMSLSPQIPAIINAELGPWMDGWLAQQGLKQSDIQGWGVHPGGPRILQATEDGLRLDPMALQPSRDILSRFGNMSSPTVLFVLQQMLESRNDLPIVLLGYGPGLAIEAALVQ